MGVGFSLAATEIRLVTADALKTRLNLSLDATSRRLSESQSQYEKKKDENDNG